MVKKLMTTVWILTALLLGISSIVAASEDYEFVWKVPDTAWYFNNPWGVAVDGNGNVYVADTYNHRIQKFTSDGVFLTKWGSYGSGDGQFNYPEGIAVDGSGNVYVADSGNNRIQKFTADGIYLTKWGSEGSRNGQFVYPTGVAVDAGGNV